MNHYYPDSPHIRKKDGFLKIWKRVSGTCLSPFKLLRIPHADLVKAYNELISNLCDGHERVYELTTCEFKDSPTLERGRDGSVKGDDQLGTQVLVILYLVRDFINEQAKSCKEFVDDGPVSAYVDSFERFTVGVNCLKCCFSYHHWVWLKWGIPEPHNIPPIELMALVIWTESVVQKINQPSLKQSIKNVVDKVRCKDFPSIEEIESVKRLSLNLYLLLPDSRFYMSIVEETYTTQLTEYFLRYSGSAGRKSPEDYIQWCDLQLKREMTLACSFLHRSSYTTVIHRLLTVLLVEEIDNLRTPICTWLKNSDEPKNRYALQILAKWVPKGPEKLKLLFTEMGKRSTFEELNTQIEKNKKRTKCDATKKKLSSSEHYEKLEITLRAVRSVLNYFYRLLAEVFHNNETLIESVCDEVFQKITDDCSSEDEALSVKKYTALKELLLQFSIEEIESNYSDALDTLDGEPGSMWIGSVFKRLSEKESSSFCVLYCRSLRLRLVETVYRDQSIFMTELKRERNMVFVLYANGASFDFLNRCVGMIEDAYKISIKFWSNPLVRPLVLKSFLWQLGGNESTDAVNHDDVHSFVNKFLFSYGKNCPGLKASYFQQFSVAKVKVKSVGAQNLKLIVGMNDLGVLMKFNERRKWPLALLAQAAGLTVKQCQSILQVFTEKSILRFTSKTNDVVEVPDFFDRSLAGIVMVNRIPFGSSSAAALAYSGRSRNSGAAAVLSGESGAGGADLLHSSSKPISHTLGMEAQVVHLLKQEGPLAASEVQARVLQHLSAFHVSVQVYKDTMEKLVEKNVVEIDLATQQLRFVA